MQLKETGSGEATTWLAEMAVLLGATGKEEEAAHVEVDEDTTILVKVSTPTTVLSASNFQ